MASSTKAAKWLAVAVAAVVLSGCSNLSQRDRNTVIGASIGAAAGSLLTNGDAVGTVGGAAVGGVIGNQIETRRDRHYHHHPHYR